ncbi:MAG: gliding motility-associated C-terminal domain-containing protein [Saprospiraceae bacterium]|nr:gliding motility-associated C-terminal domain-containing protein [Saprospiraceae bacterium]
MTIRLLIWIAGMLYCSYSIRLDFGIAQAEICDNALDDDADGLIDLNDPDCDCPVVKPASLIPNPSFEMMDCCPSGRSQLNCAETWIQASEATTDYINTCGWMGWNNLPPPLPFPDGQGIIGFRNGLFGDTIQPNFKEYTGACLLSPMLADTMYRLRFHIGFLNEFISPPTNVVFYGTANCNNLPFGIGNIGFGCPLNGTGWEELGRVSVQGLNEWKEENITLIPRKDIVAIAIGPDCERVSAVNDIYYFFDNLILGDQRNFDFDISVIGHPCAEEFVLQIPGYDDVSYQWYKDGVALIGETKSRLQVTSGEGNYQVRVATAAQCRVTAPYRHTIPTYITELEGSICKDESYILNGRGYNKTGVYWDTLKTAFNCDSFVRLSLRVVDESFDTVRAKIFSGEFYKIGRLRYDQKGDYNVVLASSQDCDSLVHLILDLYQVFIPNAFSPNGDGSNDRFTIFGGEDLVSINNLQIFNRWGGLVFQKQHFQPNDAALGWNGLFKNEPAQSGVYVYLAQLEMDDGVERPFSGSLVLIR